MRHRKLKSKLSRTSEHLKALKMNLINSLFLYGRITTTTKKAKNIRREAERLITLAKKQTLHARRQAMAFLRNKKVVHKLFTEIGPLFKERNGGYTRIIKLPKVRVGDNTPLSIIELVETPQQKEEKATS